MGCSQCRGIGLSGREEKAKTWTLRGEKPAAWGTADCGIARPSLTLPQPLHCGVGTQNELCCMAKVGTCQTVSVGPDSCCSPGMWSLQVPAW